VSPPDGPGGVDGVGGDGNRGRGVDGGDDGEGALDDVGLSAGERVRWQRRSGGHWHEGVVIRREPDGSIAVHDEEGAWRSLPVDRLETRARTRRGATRWQPVTTRAAHPHQLGLFD
jgi:hypothetical protein